MKKKCRICLSTKLIALFSFVFVFQAYAETDSQVTRVSLNRSGASIEEVLREIERKCDYSFLYNNKLIDVSRKVNVAVTDGSLDEVLHSIFGELVEVKMVDRQIVLTPVNGKASTERASVAKVPGAVMSAQERITVKGVVIDETGETLPGVSVVVKGTTNGTATAIDGSFTLSVPGNTVLVFSFIGYQSQEVSVANKTALKVVLKSDSKRLDEVVVVGYGTTKVRDLTGSVASVGASELEKTSVTNVASILEGKAAGVMVSSGAAKPGEPIKMRVRGSTSLNGTNEPLYVVDGVPIEQAEMVSINPSDIQSMDILKDASAAAIYGSRAANGVIIITTKRGRQSSKPQLSLHHYTGIDTEIKNFEILSADDYRRVMMQAARNTLTVESNNQTALDIVNGRTLMDNNTNWYDLLSQTAVANNTELAVRGGSDRIRYFVSLGMTSQDGVIKGDDLSRYSGRVNLDWDITDALKFGTNINLNYTQQNRSGQGLWQIKKVRPDVPVYDANGDFYKINGNTDNPVALTNKTNKAEDYRFTGTFFGELELITDLKLKSSLSLSKGLSTQSQYSPSYLEEGSNKGRYEGKAYESHSESLRTLWDNTLSYNHTFGDIHSVDAVAGVSFENSENRSFSATGVDFPMDEIMNNLGSASTPYAVNGTSSGRGLLSTFGRVNYKLMDKYMFTFTARYDGSSKFGENTRFGFFPSGAFAWKINKESFLENVKEINELKFRVSAGVTGTQNIGDYNNKDLYGNNDYLGRPGITPTVLGNRDLKWETTKQYDIAVDYALWDYRLTGSLGYYHKDTDDLLWYIKFPMSLKPFDGMYKNVGRVVNRGWEFSANVDIYRDTEVKWDMSLNMSGNRNRVKSLIEEGSGRWAGEGNMHGSSEVLAEGYAVGSTLGYRTKGIFKSFEEINEYNKRAQSMSEGKASTYNGTEVKPGHLILEDVNGDGFISDDDRVIIGNPEPKLFGGFSSNVSWKGLSLYAMFNFSVGSERSYNNTMQNIPGQLSNLIDYNLDNRWSPDNQSSKLPALYVDDAVAPTNDLMMHDASYLKLSNLRLQYELPPFLKSKFYKSGQVYFSVSNVFTLTKYPGIDPAMAGSTTSNYGGNYDSDAYPGVRTYTVGLKLNF